LEAGTCQRTGLPFDLRPPVASKRHPFSPSLDRIDGREGYVTGNVRVVVSAFNVARNEWGDEVFEAVARAYFNT